jgi:hypothetical protein
MEVMRHGLSVTLRSHKVRRKLQKISSAQGAHVALMAALIKTEMLNDRIPGSDVTIRQVAEAPMSYSTDLCSTAFELLKEKRRMARDRVKSYAANKIVPPPDIREYMDLCDLALSLWMITVSVRCRPSSFPEVVACWRRVISHIPSADDVRALMVRSDYGFCNFKCQPIATKEWIWLANQMPVFEEAGEPAACSRKLFV